MKKHLKPWVIIIVLVIYNIAMFGGSSIIRDYKDSQTLDAHISKSSIQKIHELATYDCFYHNVFEWSKSGNIRGGAKKLWIEYDGRVRVGIKDAIEISEPDKNNVITVTIPDAVILEMDLDEKSIYEIHSESPLWGFVPLYNSVNIEERKAALVEAQNDMEASASNNAMILDEAKERAKMIIEQNIKTAKKAEGTECTVKFVDAPEAQTVSSEEEAS